MSKSDDRSADVVIIGCGVAAAWTAFFLGLGGIRRVVVVEREYPGAGASSRGSGITRVHYSNIAEMRLALEGQRHYGRWADEIGVGSAGWRPTGLLWLVGPADVDRLRQNVTDQVALGALASVLSPTEIASIQPNLDLAGIGAALHEPESGTVIGTQIIQGLVSRLLSQGVRVRTHVATTAIKRRRDRVVGVETTAGMIATETVVLAAGAWSARLAATAHAELPVIPTRATIGTAFYPPSIEPAMALFDNTLDFAFAPKAGGHWAIVPVRDVGFLKETDPDAVAAPAPGAVEAGLALLRRRIPAMRDAVPAERWAAADGCTADRKPIVGAHPDIEGLFVHVGGNFKGLKVAPAASSALADLIIKGPSSDSLISPFSMDRFRSAPTDSEDDRQYAGARWT
jgi:sarcosine oxidase subunit beta